MAQATGILESARYAGFAAGPLLAGALATLGPRPALLVNAASFIAIAVAVGALRARRRPPTGATREKLRALDGFRQLRRDRVLRVTLGAAVGGLLFISASLTVEIFYLKDVVGASDAEYALLLCVWMAGMVVRRDRAGQARPHAAGRHRRAPRARRPGLRHGPADRLGGAPGRVRGLPDPAASATGVKNVLLRALLTARVPEAVHGRAFAAYNAARNVAELVAVGAGGVLVTALGPRAALLLAGLGPILAALAGLSAHRPRWALRAELDPARA